jgi:hypothetical protein
VSSVDLADDLGVDEEYYVSVDRLQLLESDLDECQITVSDKSVSFKFKGPQDSRSASLKKRNENSRRPKFPSLPFFNGSNQISKREFEFILKQVSASAQVKATKTDEDMRINQVHFYGHSNLAISNARFYASVIRSDKIDFDLSLVSSDLPLIRSYVESHAECSQFEDTSSVYFVAPQNTSWLSVNKVAGEKPKDALPVLSDASCSITMTKESFKNLINWGEIAIEGTQRVTLSAESSLLKVMSGSNELASVSVAHSGSNLNSDFPISVLSTISDHLDDNDVHISYGFESHPDILTISQSYSDQTFSKHYIRSMRSK